MLSGVQNSQYSRSYQHNTLSGENISLLVLTYFRLVNGHVTLFRHETTVMSFVHMTVFNLLSYQIFYAIDIRINLYSIVIISRVHLTLQP